jgi:hypothetical protein
VRRFRPEQVLFGLALAAAVVITLAWNPLLGPAVACFAMLAAGWYPGERAIDRLRCARMPAARRPRAEDVALPAAPLRVVATHRRLLVGGLVRRGPPVLVAS